MGALRRNGQRLALEVRFDHAVMHAEEIPGAEQARATHTGEDCPPHRAQDLLLRLLLLLLDLLFDFLFDLFLDDFLAHEKNLLFG